MFNNKKAIDFGKFLHDLRIENSYTLKDVTTQTGIDKSTLSKLENGETQKANPELLKKLADLYNVNVIDFFIMLEYISSDDIIASYISLKNEKYIFKKEIKTQHLKIPILKTKDILFDTIQNKFFNISNIDEDFFAFSNSSHEYYIFKKTDTLNKDDIGVFEVNKKIYIARYAFEDKFVLISDILSGDVVLKEKSDINIIGRVFYIINVN